MRMARPSCRPPITMTAATNVSGFGQSTKSAIAAATTAHACTTSSAPAMLDLRRRRAISAEVSTSAAFTMPILTSSEDLHFLAQCSRAFRVVKLGLVAKLFE